MLKNSNRAAPQRVGDGRLAPPTPPTSIPAYIAIILAIATVIMILVLSPRVKAEPVHRCRGVWTGNSCIGSWSNVDDELPYEGDTYVGNRDRRVRQDRRQSR